MNAIAEPLDRDRAAYIGGSDVGAIMGISPWKTPLALWLEKTGQSNEPPPDKFRKRILERGKKLEPFVLDMVVDKLREQGHEVEIVATNARYQHPDHPFLSCEIDFELMLDGEHINGDCKTVSGFARAHWGEEDTDDVPLHYAAQFMHGMGITGRRKCLVAALIGLDDVAIYWVERDDETINAMRAKCFTFWHDCVLAGKAPDPLVFSDITALFPRDNGAAIEATADVVEQVRELADINHKIKSLEERKEELRFQIANYISPNARLTLNGKDIATWKGQDRASFDSKRFKQDNPDLAAKYITNSTVRVLLLKKEKSA